MITSSKQRDNAKFRTCAHQWATSPQTNVDLLSRMLRVVANCVHCGESRSWTFHHRGKS